MLTKRGFSVLSVLPAYVFVSWISNQSIFIVSGMLIMFIIIIDSVIFKLNFEKIAWVNIERIVSQNYVEVGNELLVQLKINNILNTSLGPLIIEEIIADSLKIVKWNDENTITIPPKGTIQLEYVIQVLGLGKHKIYGTKITINDTLGLFTANVLVKNESYIITRPNLSLVALSIEPYINEYSYSGLSKAISGLSKEFAEIRQYLPGDDYKSLAWKIISKRPDHSLLVKEYIREEHINIKIILDASEHMAKGLSGKRKIDVAISSIIALCYMASKLKDNIDILVYPHFIRRVFTHRDKNQFQNIINFLSTIMPEGERDLIKLSNYLKNALQRGELVFIITDTDVVPMHLLTLINNIRIFKGTPIITLLNTSKFLYPSAMDTTKLIAYNILTTVYNSSLTELSKLLKSNNVIHNLCDTDNCSQWLLTQYVKFRTLKGVTL
ncbi:MAG: DUF58 domain-containing protein [Thermoprotei archaeon]